jgi:DNA helicase HerA-like ATPase
LQRSECNAEKKVSPRAAHLPTSCRHSHLTDEQVLTDEQLIQGAGMALGNENLLSGDHVAVEAELYRRLSTLETSSRSGLKEDLRTTPLTTLSIKDIVERKYGIDSGGQRMFDQYAVLGFHNGGHAAIKPNEPVLLNVNAPNSVFICGSQGSGKSYTLSCMLENCLVADARIGRVQQPLAGLAFHFDPDSAGGVAETAYLCSMGIPVNVLVSQSNEHALRAAYSKIPGAENNLTVTPLLLRASDISIERMHRLMAFSDKDSAMPLYMSVILRLLRQLAISTGGSFDYLAFKKLLEKERLTKDQLGPLNLRLELLESYLDLSPASRKASSGSLLNLKAGTLTIVDLTDPFVDPATACILFDICLSLVKEHRSSGGLVVALDEAHRYMTASLASSGFTERLLGTIREQRHNATRVIIATQEPTVSEKLLDLCSVSIIHRFTSPAWFSALQHHLGAASQVGTSDLNKQDIFKHIMDLSVGESLVFAPSAFLCLESNGTPAKLGRVAVDMKTRTRLGNDGGMSILTSTHIDPPSKLYESGRHKKIEAVHATGESRSNKSKPKAKPAQQSSEAYPDGQDDLLSYDIPVTEQKSLLSPEFSSKSYDNIVAANEASSGPIDALLLNATIGIDNANVRQSGAQPAKIRSNEQMDGQLQLPAAQSNEQSDGPELSKKKKKKANRPTDDADSTITNEEGFQASLSKGPDNRGLPASTPTGPGAKKVTRSQEQPSSRVSTQLGVPSTAKPNGLTLVTSTNTNGKNKGAQPSHTHATTPDPSSKSSLDLSPEKSHLFLICSLCKQLALIEFATPNLPRLDIVFQKENKSGLAYTACATCRCKADPTGIITSTAVNQLEKEQLIKFSHGGPGPEMSTLRKQLQTAAYLSGGLPRLPGMFTDKSGPLYLHAVHVEAHINDRCRLSSIELVNEDGKKGAMSIKARPHRRESFFQNVRNAGALDEYTRFGDLNDSATARTKVNAKSKENGAVKVKGPANLKEKTEGNAKAKLNGKVEAKANGKALEAKVNPKKTNEKAAAIPLEMW